MLYFMYKVTTTTLKASFFAILYTGCIIMGIKIALITKAAIANVFIAFLVSVVLSAFCGSLIGAIVDWVIEKYRDIFGPSIYA